MEQNEISSMSDRLGSGYEGLEIKCSRGRRPPSLHLSQRIAAVVKTMTSGIDSKQSNCTCGSVRSQHLLLRPQGARVSTVDQPFSD